MENDKNERYRKQNTTMIINDWLIRKSKKQFQEKT
jgi:hypothetical protein